MVKPFRTAPIAISLKPGIFLFQMKKRKSITNDRGTRISFHGRS
ncbi:hypothetical protein Tmari_1475 [Thermotoga maritima MSB8]|nr:hypothetical protein Tmari_1475 [Thermotoga maritima MSB8]